MIRLKENRYILFPILLICIFISGCQQYDNLSDNETIILNETQNVTAAGTPITFDVNIKSLACDWKVISDDYGNKRDCIRMISKGTAQGPVGSRVEIPILAWSDDIFDCGVWTHKTGALIAVGHTCLRDKGQPEATNWSVDTGGNDDCPLKDYFDSKRAHSVKIYDNSDIKPQDEDRKEIVCR